MSVIKDAFTEGRNTKVSWEKSKAKKNDIKLQVAVSNAASMNQKQDRKAPVSLEMIDPETGATLAYFPSRFAAAVYIVNEILKRPDKSPYAVTGNLEICMRGGWKSYGYLWKITDKPIKNDMTNFDITTEGIVVYRGNKKFNTYYSYSELAKLLEIDRGVLRKRVLRGSTIDTTGKYSFVRNPVITHNYKSKDSANTGWAYKG